MKIGINKALVSTSSMETKFQNAELNVFYVYWKIAFTTETKFHSK